MSFLSIIGPNLCHSFALQVPASTEDSDFEGPETDMYVLCHGHGKAAERCAAFEGVNRSSLVMRHIEERASGCLPR